MIIRCIFTKLLWFKAYEKCLWNSVFFILAIGETYQCQPPKWSKRIRKGGGSVETDTRHQPNENEVRKKAPPYMQPEELIRAWLNYNAMFNKALIE